MLPQPASTTESDDSRVETSREGRTGLSSALVADLGNANTQNAFEGKLGISYFQRAATNRQLDRTLNDFPFYPEMKTASSGHGEKSAARAPLPPGSASQLGTILPLNQDQVPCQEGSQANLGALSSASTLPMGNIGLSPSQLAELMIANERQQAAEAQAIQQQLLLTNPMLYAQAAAIQQQQFQQQQLQQQLQQFQQQQQLQQLAALTSAPGSLGLGMPPAANLMASAPTGQAAARLPRQPVVLYMECDADSLSPYQCLMRKQIELFEATTTDVETNAQGRNRPIVLGQVGIRCRHCHMLPPKHRARGAVYYPAKLTGAYQAAQNMAVCHLADQCQHVPTETKEKLIQLRERKSSAGGGKNYWADGIRVLGVFEDANGLRFQEHR